MASASRPHRHRSLSGRGAKLPAAGNTIAQARPKKVKAPIRVKGVLLIQMGSGRLIVNALVVPDMPADIAQIQEAQAKAPGSVRLGQAFEKIRDGLVLGTAPWAVAKAALADPEGPQASAMLSPFVATALAANSRR